MSLEGKVIRNKGRRSVIDYVVYTCDGGIRVGGNSSNCGGIFNAVELKANTIDGGTTTHSPTFQRCCSQPTRVIFVLRPGLYEGNRCVLPGLSSNKVIVILVCSEKVEKRGVRRLKS